jgi:hypothetical protein
MIMAYEGSEAAQRSFEFDSLFPTEDGTFRGQGRQS